jgi:hypothetical protein
MSFLKNISQYWFRLQMDLFPWLEGSIGELSEKQRLLVSILEFSNFRLSFCMWQVEKYLKISKLSSFFS